MVVWTAKKGLVLNNVKIIFDRIIVQYYNPTPIVFVGNSVVVFAVWLYCIGRPRLDKGFYGP